MRVIYWLAIFIVLLIIEIATMGLTTIWFAGGALLAFCAGLVGFGLGRHRYDKGQRAGRDSGPNLVGEDG